MRSRKLFISLRRPFICSCRPFICSCISSRKPFICSFISARKSLISVRWVRCPFKISPARQRRQQKSQLTRLSSLVLQAFYLQGIHLREAIISGGQVSMTPTIQRCPIRISRISSRIAWLLPLISSLRFPTSSLKDGCCFSSRPLWTGYPCGLSHSVRNTGLHDVPGTPANPVSCSQHQS